MRSMLRGFGLLATVALGASARADNDAQLWLQVVANFRLQNGWRAFAELQPRFGDSFGREEQFIARAAIGHTITREFTLFAGYGWTPNIEPDFNSEDRYFLQGTVLTRLGAWSMDNRTRLEYRQVDGVGDPIVRLRHQIRAVRPWSSGSAWRWVAYNELFLNLSSAGGNRKAGFDQNRLFGGIGYKPSANSLLEFGYQPTWIEVPRSRRFDVIRLALTLNF